MVARFGGFPERRFRMKLTCVDRRENSPIERWWPNPKLRIASACVMDLDATKTRILRKAVFPVWERLNGETETSHDISNIKMFWVKMNEPKRREVFVRIKPSPTDREICMAIDLCPAGNPVWVDVWHGPTNRFFTFGSFHPDTCAH